MRVEVPAGVWGLLVMQEVCPSVEILAGIGIHVTQDRKTAVSVEPILC